MKIGIITFHRASNYGAVLQCYALVTYLKKNGYYAEVVDYRSKSIELAYRLLKFSSLRVFLSSLIYLHFRCKSNNNFRNFISSFLPLSKKIYYSASEICDYDILIIGSDQIWNQRITKGFDNVYWGDIPNGKKIITYAASMGTEVNLLKEDKEKIKQYLLNFDYISVREYSLYETIKGLTDKPIEMVLDPTFLLYPDDYSQLISPPADNNYILYYQMEYHKDAKKRVCEIADQLGCDIIVLGGKKERYSRSKRYCDSSNVTVSEFLGYVFYAKCVFASTFHGVAFSLIFHKDFYFLANGKTDRAVYLLESLGAKDRVISPEVSVSFSNVDYSIINTKIQYRQKQSFDYLEKAIKSV